jgi:hypothetical protein
MGQATDLLHLGGDGVQQALDTILLSAVMLGAFLNLDKSIPNLLKLNYTNDASENFDYISEQIIKNTQGSVESLILSPSGVIEYVFPFITGARNNREFIQLDALNPICFDEAKTQCQPDYRSISLDAMNYGTAVSLDCLNTGNPCLLAIHPIFVDYIPQGRPSGPEPGVFYYHADYVVPASLDRSEVGLPSNFWGFSSVIALVDSVQEGAWPEEVLKGYCLFLSSQNIVVHVNPCMQKTFGVKVGQPASEVLSRLVIASQDIGMLHTNNTWTAHAIPIDGWTNTRTLDLSLSLVFFALFGAIWFLADSFASATKTIVKLGLEQEGTKQTVVDLKAE